MPLQKLVFRPGVNREATSYANEGGWFESNKVRFRSGQPEKIGGWVIDNGPLSTIIENVTTTIAYPPTGTLWGTVRAMWNWVTLYGYNLLALGSNLKYYIQNGPGGAFFDITPIRLRTGPGAPVPTASPTFTPAFSTLSANITSFASVIPVVAGASFGGTSEIGGKVLIGTEEITYGFISGNDLSGCVRGVNGTTAAAHTSGDAVGGYTVFVNDVGNGVQTGDFVTFNAAASLGGDITATVLNAEFQVTEIDADNYIITLSEACNVSDVGDGGAATNAAYQITTASDIFTTGVGWGAGVWGSFAGGPGWGDPAPAGLGVGLQLRLWSQSNFGENLVFASRGGPIYYWAANANPNIFDRGIEILAGSDMDGLLPFPTVVDSTCPDAVNFVMVSDSSRFVIAFGANDPTGVYATEAIDPMQVRWSDQESFIVWTPDSVNQAGDYRLSKGSAIITAIQTRQEILVLTDSAIYSMQYLGPPYVWGFQILGDNISIAGPNAITTANNITYWMGVDKFYVYSGRVQTLPCTLREYVFTDINMSQSFQFFAGTNEGYSEVWWFYCSANSTVIDRYVIYDFLEETWCYGDWDNYQGQNQGRTAWLDSPLRSTPMSVIYGSLDGTTNGSLLYQETGTDDATVNPPVPISAFIQSSDFDIGDGHNFGFVWRLIPDLTFDGSTVNNPTAMFTTRPRAFPGSDYGVSDNPDVISAQNYQQTRTYTVQQFTEQVYVRIRGRQMAFKVSSEALGTQWQLGTTRIDIRPDGRRK